MATVFRVSPKAFMFSRKYSTCTSDSDAVLENEQVIFTSLPGLIIARLSEDWTTEYPTTTGFGTVRDTIFAAPGVGRSANVALAIAGRTAIQLAGSLDAATLLTR